MSERITSLTGTESYVSKFFNNHRGKCLTKSDNCTTFVAHSFSCKLGAAMRTDTVEANLDGTIGGTFDLFRNLGILVIEYTFRSEVLEGLVMMTGRSSVNFETSMLSAMHQHGVSQTYQDPFTFASWTATNETEAAPLQIKMESPAETLGFLDDAQGRGILRCM